MELENIGTIAVLGAGTMGHGIAEVAALAGYDVRLRDISEERVQDGYEQIEWSIEKMSDGDRLTKSDADAALKRIETFVRLDDTLEGVDLVIEVVPEKFDVKREVYGEIESLAPAYAVFVTNTSTFSITELAAATERAERFCGMHFFNPPVRMPLIEIIAGAKSSEATLALVESFAKSLGKTPIRVRKDVPGFVVNRVLVPILNEGAWQVHTGVATVEEVDSTAKHHLDLPMGCFELADQIGIDVIVDVIGYMHETLGDGYEPAPPLIEKAREGKVGKKSGVGFYEYVADSADVPDDCYREDVAERLVGVAVNETAKLVAADVATAEEIDEAVTLGAGFPAGPTELADQFGYERILSRLDELAASTSKARYEPAPFVEQWAARRRVDGGTVSDRSYDNLRCERPREGVSHVILDRPDRMNTLSPDLLSELAELVELLAADDDVRAILLTGAGDRAFSAGADVHAMADDLEPDAATDLSRYGQRSVGVLEDVSVPIVVGVDGVCLGGGMELAACADYCVASERSTFGQPEVSLGIIPGWGGTQRLSRIVGERRAREIVLTGEQYDAEEMHEFGFVNDVTESDALLECALERAARFADGPPLAYAAIKRAMRTTDFEAGLETEAEAFGELFEAEDTREGIDAFLNQREPDFVGR